ncbi:MAG TPA: GDP-L-fucose synthase [Saprospiraceae bacterium]|nr:GDP-L-fucose synthase [Saprospiraceae bacterium]HMX82133.1 GDP-L-fucose synthase [Saprospiraceae bacterium]HMX84971.1 GDP-L-fucose synthase [Saprospiraceae bacterium]HMZ72604.1 GDP-L-fucose synthase [Saprospiraceae bacterium]HNA93292.1 GDP-L-fucose synthase [Saprospiraceae bacterium]
MMQKNSRIYVAGHRGMVGSAIVRLLEAKGFTNILTSTSTETDLRNQAQVNAFFEKNKPEYVFMAAAKVGGIHSNNTYRAEFLYDNLMIEANIIEASRKNEVEKLLFLGSSCIYPKMAPQPIREEHLLTGTLEYTNEPYAIAKIAGIKLCEAYRDQYGCNFISVMPTNLYGPNDNYDLNNSHVLPAMIRKFHEAKKNGSASVVIWGTGTPRREFMHVDDLADACFFLMENYNEKEFVNIGFGEDITILDLAKLVKDTVDYEGEIIHDLTKPDGTPRKLMDSSKLNGLGWKPATTLAEGIRAVYEEVKHKL